MTRENHPTGLPSMQLMWPAAAAAPCVETGTQCGGSWMLNRLLMARKYTLFRLHPEIYSNTAQCTTLGTVSTLLIVCTCSGIGVGEL